MQSTISISTSVLVFYDERRLDEVHDQFSEQEWQRTMESSNVDDRTEHEMYGHPFLRSVMAGVAAVMCSYSPYSFAASRPHSHGTDLQNFEFVDQINETYACENDRTLNQILKGEVGFRGRQYPCISLSFTK